MASSPLLRQPAFNPNFGNESKQTEAAVVNSIDTTDTLIAIDELVSTMRDQNKPAKRLTRRIADTTLWKMFQILVAMIAASLACIILYLVYYFLYKDEVDHVIEQITGYFANLAEMIRMTAAVIREIHDTVIMIEERAKNFSRFAHDELQKNDDWEDALILAVN